MSGIIDSLSTSTAIIRDVITIFGIPYGVYIFLKHQRKEALERDMQNYNELDDKYFEFLTVNIEHPKIRIDVPAAESDSLSKLEKSQQESLFFMLVSMLERAFILFKNDKSKARKSQRDGWYDYMFHYGGNDTFRKLWKNAGNQFDLGFMTYMDGIVSGKITAPIKN